MPTIIYPPGVTEGDYVIGFQDRFTSDPGTNSILFIMKNGSTRVLYIGRVYVIFSFDGTAAASTGRVRFSRLTLGTYTSSAGNSVQPLDAAYPASTVQDPATDYGGVSVSGASIENPWFYASCPRGTSGSVAIFDWTARSNRKHDHIKIAASHGIVMELDANAVAGDHIAGLIQWYERVS